VAKKDTNPKDAIGIKKPPMSTVPLQVIHEVGVGMMEGAMKYRRHNYRIAGIRASVYYDATKRHLDYWWEGEDTDPDSGLSHVTKAICSLVVLRDAMINKKWEDDRPPSVNVAAHREEMQKIVDGLFEKYPNPLQAHVKGENE
tara:strand:+ start:1475 stop:1903 length:429 start_codon:yes stop_codon:yes gene_type:complete